MLIEECNIKNPNDLKERTGGDGGYQNQKHKSAVWCEPIPICLTSNKRDLLPIDDDPKNPWPSRTYYHVFEAIPDDSNVWNETTRKYRLNPRALIPLFQQFNLL